MTEDTLKLANNKMHTIEETRHHIEMLQRMRNLDSINLHSSAIGTIVLKGNIKDEVLAAVLHDKEEWLEELKDDFRML